MELIGSALSAVIVIGGLLVARNWLAAIRAESAETRRDTAATRALVEAIGKALPELIQRVAEGRVDVIEGRAEVVEVQNSVAELREGLVALAAHSTATGNLVKMLATRSSSVPANPAPAK